MNELTQVLAQETADFEEGGAALQALDDCGVDGRLVDEGIEKEANAGTWVRADSPSLVALWACECVLRYAVQIVSGALCDYLLWLAHAAARPLEVSHCRSPARHASR